MARFVKRITVVDATGGGAETLYKARRKKKKKISGWFRPLERMERRMLEATKTFGSEALSRHKKSRRKRKNAFLTDGPKNFTRAGTKAFKKLRKI